MAERLLGDTIYVNPMVLGYAWQKGWVPLARQSLARAIELNGVQVKNNLTAFEWGRQAAHDWQRVQQALASAGAQQAIEFKPRQTLNDLIESRAQFLTAYQNAAYAADYRAFVAQVRQAESALDKTTLTEAVARNLFKLMASKDEYEVARLHTDPAFLARIDAMFEGDYSLHHHMAPPLLARRNEQGEPVKKKYGPAMLRTLRLLASLKGLRGTPLDIFGRTAERRAERALTGQYHASITQALRQLNADSHATALELARVPEQIKGFGHVKERNLKAARTRWDELLARLQPA
jgi:indolepyruvate ferredoxin oxidoreductase